MLNVGGLDANTQPREYLLADSLHGSALWSVALPQLHFTSAHRGQLAAGLSPTRVRPFWTHHEKRHQDRSLGAFSALTFREAPQPLTDSAMLLQEVRTRRQNPTKSGLP